MRKIFIKAKWNRVVDGNLFPFVEKKIFKDCINFDILKKKNHGLLGVWGFKYMIY